MTQVAGNWAEEGVRVYVLHVDIRVIQNELRHVSLTDTQQARKYWERALKSHVKCQWSTRAASVVLQAAGPPRTGVLDCDTWTTARRALPRA